VYEVNNNDNMACVNDQAANNIELKIVSYNMHGFNHGYSVLIDIVLMS